MKNFVQKKEKGFTIVEVSLVLAIAGLIFLMIFLALPAVQRTQKDAERREDIDTLLSSIKKYQTNNRGALPGGNNKTGTAKPDGSGTNASWQKFYNDYLGSDFTDPEGFGYTLDVKLCENDGDSHCSSNITDDTEFPNDYKIEIILQASCDGSMAKPSNNPRTLAARYKMQGPSVYCNNI